jgi:iron(III) transport system permease protein
MTAARALYALGLFVFVALPLAMPFVELTRPSAWVWTQDDGVRLLHLGVNTITLTAGTVALSLPLGACLAVLLFRTSFLGQRFFLVLLALALFVPLPIVVSSWQGFFGSDGWLPVSLWRGSEYRPWVTGMGPAIWISVLAATPWVAFIVGIGLTWVEPELEDEAAQVVGPWRVLFLVTIPRVRASVLAAGLFVVLQTAGEISVTDVMSVRTLAEEVRTQFALGDRAATARSVLLCLPILLGVWGAVLATLVRLEKTLPPLMPATRTHRPFDLGWPGARCVAVVALLAILAVPSIGILWKLGLSGQPRAWHSETALDFLQNEARVNGKNLLSSLLTSLAAGVLTAALGVTGCWLARDRAWLRWLLFSVATWAWVLPGPVVGIALQKTIQVIVSWQPDGVAATLLYRAPSPLPLVWAQTLRALPIAVVFLWPIVRMIPRELFEEARLDGAGAVGEFLQIVEPMTRRPFVLTALVCAALCLAEVAAGMCVETPGWESFTKIVYTRMHDGAENAVAALSVLMLGSIVVIGAMGGVSNVTYKLRDGISEPRTQGGSRPQPKGSIDN